MVKKKVVVKSSRARELTDREKARLKLIKHINKGKKRLEKGEKLSVDQKLALDGERFVNLVIGIEEWEQFMDVMCLEKTPTELFQEWVRSKI